MADKITNERVNETDKQEDKYIREVRKQYSEAYSNARLIIAAYLVKYGVDGKFTQDFYKSNRYNRLVSDLTENLATIKLTNPQEMSSYIKDQFELNFYYSGYGLETKYQTKLNFQPIKRKNIDPMSITGKISLKQNKQIVKANINKAITQAIAQGEGLGKASRRVKKALESNMNNAIRIAQTETTTASNEANLQAMEKAKKKIPIMKQWLAIKDERTRRSHRLLDGEIVPIDKPFSNGLMYPGDQSGPPEEVINCRCRMREIIPDQTPTEYQRVKGTDGKNKVIEFKSYKDWKAGRL